MTYDITDILVFIIDWFGYIFAKLIENLDRIKIGNASLFDFILIITLVAIILNIVIALPNRIDKGLDRRAMIKDRVKARENAERRKAERRKNK